MADSDLNWAAMPLTGVFETQDGAVVVVGAFKENPLRAICMALEIADLSSEARFATLDEQIKHKRELQTVFRQRYKTNTTAHWLARLEAQDLLCAPVRNLREALADPQTAHNEMVLQGHDGDQEMRLIGSPIRMSNAPAEMLRAPPRLGEHTEEVLAEARAMAAASLD